MATEWVTDYTDLYASKVKVQMIIFFRFTSKLYRLLTYYYPSYLLYAVHERDNWWYNQSMCLIEDYLFDIFGSTWKSKFNDNFPISNDLKTKIAQLRFNLGANNLLSELNDESNLVLYGIKKIKGFSVKSIKVYVKVFQIKYLALRSFWHTLNNLHVLCQCT